MARLMIVLLFMTVLVGIALGMARQVGQMAEAGRVGWARIEAKGHKMQRLSGILLLALILYVSVWGGA